MQPCFYFIKQSIEIFFALSFQCAFPHDKDTPACLPQRFVSARVPCLVAFKFLFPEILVCIGEPEKMAVMKMPETTVNEYDGVILLQRHIRFAGQSAVIDPVAVAF